MKASSVSGKRKQEVIEISDTDKEYPPPAKTRRRNLRSRQSAASSARVKDEELNETDDETEEEAWVPAFKGSKGKARAVSPPVVEPPVKAETTDKDEEDDLLEEVEDDLVSRPAVARPSNTRRRGRASIAKIENGNGDDFDDEDDDDDFIPSSSRGKRQSRPSANSRQSWTKKEEEEDVISEYSDASSLSELHSESESGSDEPLASSSRGQRGVYQEEQRYETAKQRARRLKSEAWAAKRKKKTLTHFEKTKLALEQHHPELKGLWEKLKDSVSVIKPEQIEQPKGLTIKLLPFQREGLDWLTKQERGQWKGGMLADEMGMGKTIQMISLMLSDRKKPCLVVAPTVAIIQWRNEIEQYTDPKLKVVLWHGANRTSDIKLLKSADVVLTSYAVLESSYRKQEAGFRRKGEIIKEDSALHAIHWRRIILDEAHNIKERATNTAKGSFALKGDFRWCLSGTPLQNRVGELYSMIRFLGGDPYAFYYCKKCTCKSLHWSFSNHRNCDSCGHTPMHHTCFWNNEILKPIQRHGVEEGYGREAFARLRLLLERMMLRRTKLERADDMGLPPRTIEVRRDMFNEEEEDLYRSLYTDTTRKFSTYLDHGTVLNNYSNIFTLLTRMRQLANHPDLVLRSKTGLANKLLGDDQGEIHVCRICLEEAEDAIMSRCRHIFCRECVRQYLDAEVAVGGDGPDCPYCHATLSIDLEAEALEPPAHRAAHDQGRQGILSRLDMNKWRSSTKIEALVEELTQLRSDDKTIKSLVFSQFVNFLDLIAFRLQRAGFQICRLEGNMSPEARNRTIKHFMENPNVTVFLVSLKAGGVALNLTEASRVYLMDPWWNPSVEVQAMDRIHRLGQHRPIVVKRMVIENSIESRIIELQNKKSAMIEAAIGKDEAAMGRLSVADLRFLFTL